MTIAQTCLVPVPVVCPPGLPIACGGHCEYTLNIGIFFDGTGNNKDADKKKGKQAQSNVSRLSDAYKNKPEDGFFRHYIPGVGTPFEELGTSGEDFREAAAGKGGQPRIIWGLLQVLNSVNSLINGKLLFNQPKMRALCSETWVPPKDTSGNLIPRDQASILKELKLKSSLVDKPDVRSTFLSNQAYELSKQLTDPKKPKKITGIYIDVFGFSRGAAQARAFVNWLHTDMIHGGKLCGVESYVRILGIFDTVTSVGFANTKGSNHKNWGVPENLHIPKEVKTCVHFAAMHELRSSFPFDSVCNADGTMPDNCKERIFPGVHSDVGGGYGEGEQGKGVHVVTGIDNPKPTPANKFKLSQFPLNEMFDAARKVCRMHTDGKPWLDFKSEDGLQNELTEQFEVDDLVTRSVTTYLKNCGIPKLPKDKTSPIPDLSIDQALRKHGELYLRWRYLVSQKNDYKNLDSVSYARQLDTKGYDYLIKGEDKFAEQLKFIETPEVKDFQVINQSRAFSRRAAEILVTIKSEQIKVDASISDFFDRFVHDSYAGFIGTLGVIGTSLAEHEGYIRYRVAYTGTSEAKNAMLSVPQLSYMA